MARKYKDPANGSESSVGSQFNTFLYQKAALKEAAKEQYFGQMAETFSMPKHMGKKIKRYHYLPILDDANVNDEGIDANGLTTTRSVTIIINQPFADGRTEQNIYTSHYAVGEGANDGAARTAAEARALDMLVNELGYTGADYATAKADAESKGAEVVDSGAAVPVGGNLYGSSKDVGTVTSKMPALSENGGRVNRVSNRRIEIEGTFNKFGFFDEYTQESIQFDTDDQLEMHVNREMVMAANEITEDALQIDLLNAAGVVRYGGAALSTGQITGEGTVSLVSYEDLMKLSITLDNNRCPKETKIIAGSRMTDVKNIDAARYMYVGSELLPSLKRMTDLFGDPAFVPVHKYAQAGAVARGEVGSIDQFRIIVVPEMMHWAGAGATVTANEGYRETGGKYDVFPMLVVGSESFTTIGFQTDGKTTKFKIKHIKPESATSYSFEDPFGEKGFMSIKWYYGTMILRPERIALVKVVAEW